MKHITTDLLMLYIQRDDVGQILEAISAETASDKWSAGVNTIKGCHPPGLIKQHDYYASDTTNKREVLYGHGTISLHADFLSTKNLLTLVYNYTDSLLDKVGQLIMDAPYGPTEYANLQPGSTVWLNDCLLHAWLSNSNWAFFVSSYE